MDREQPPAPELVEQYRAAFGTGADAARFLREVADGWEQTGRRPYVGDHPGHWNHGPGNFGHTDDCCTDAE